MFPALEAVSMAIQLVEEGKGVAGRWCISYVISSTYTHYAHIHTLRLRCCNYPPALSSLVFLHPVLILSDNGEGSKGPSWMLEAIIPSLLTH